VTMTKANLRVLNQIGTVPAAAEIRAKRARLKLRHHPHGLSERLRNHLSSGMNFNSRARSAALSSVFRASAPRCFVIRAS